MGNKAVIYVHNENEYDVVCKVLTNHHSMSVEEALALTGIDMDEFSSKQGWCDWEPDALEIVDLEYLEKMV